ncbi:MAG: transposase [Patescibacteria group bacterium]
MAELFQEKYRISSARLRGWDYAADGYYFVTVCTKDHEEFFGEVVNKKMALNDIGKIVDEEWRKAEEIRENVGLDVWVTMPNHIHGILIINNFRKKNAGIARDTDTVETCTVEAQRVETHCNASLRRRQSQQPQYKNKFGPQSDNLSAIIRGFKGAATKQIHELGFDAFAWQPRFHDRVIRGEEELNRIRDYIFLNPDNWEKDKENLEIIFCA